MKAAWLIGPVLLLAACGGAAAPASSGAVPASAPSGFQAQWDQLVAAAKQEGKVTVGFTVNPGMANTILPAFEKQFGIQVEQVQKNTMGAQLIQESAAGVHSLDAVISSNNDAVLMHNAKLFVPLKPLLVVPDVNDKSKWAGGNGPWYFDKEQQYIVRMDRQLRYFFHVNPDVVKPDEIKTPQDLLDPKWKGKIAAFDPTISGAGQSIAADILNVMGDDYFKKLYLDQATKFANEQRVLSDWLAHNTYPIGIGLPVDEFTAVKAAGLPIARAKPDGLTAGITGVLLLTNMDKAQHPNAARLFANWMLTKEGMQIVSDAEGYAMTRADLDYSKLNPEDVPVEGARYFDEATWDYNTGLKMELVSRLKADLGR